MPRRLPEIRADLDRAMKRTKAAPLLQKHQPALEAMELVCQALDVINFELDRRPPATVNVNL